MSEESHTRGPWKFIEVIGQCTIWAERRQLLQYTSPDTENLANARLMAASPDLLEALELSLNALAHCRADAGYNSMQSRAAQAASKAIARARGES